MLRKILLFALVSLVPPSLAFARSERIRITRTRLWEIDLTGNGRVLSKEQPVLRGTVLVFHRYPDGRLVGIPQERVVAVQRSGSAPNVLQVSANVQRAHPLAPGEVIDLGQTGGVPILSGRIAVAGPRSYSPSSVGAPMSTADPGRLAIDAIVFRGDTPVPGAGGSAPSQFGYGAGGMVLNPTLVNQGSTAVTSGANGFPATAEAGTPPINPNGFPATTTTGPESGNQPINPNGFPTTTTTGSQSGIQPINPNGFPSLAEPPNAGTGRSSTQPRGPSPR